MHEVVGKTGKLILCSGVRRVDELCHGGGMGEVDELIYGGVRNKLMRIVGGEGDMLIH